tara:strand:+ start:385 stop:801 length:417 start_codon:yes stop_codon:yes gene_type:complete
MQTVGRVVAVLAFTLVMALLVAETPLASTPAVEKAKSRIDWHKAQIEIVRTENRYLSELLMYHKSPQFTTAAAKRYLGLVEPGETRVIIHGSNHADLLPVENVGSSTAAVESDHPKVLDFGFVREWLNYLTGSKEEDV